MVYTTDESWERGLGGRYILGILRPRGSTQSVPEAEGNGPYKSFVLGEWSILGILRPRGSTQAGSEASGNGLH